MDSILQKFYNGGNTSLNNGFTQFGALQSNATRPIGLSHTSKSPLPVRPLINSVNTTYHKPSLTINTNFNHLVTNKDFLRPKNLAFNSSSDLIYNNPGNVQRRYNSEYDIRKNTYADIRRNDTKMQMMEEKMKNLELKSQRLEVINDFFFDMFENNLVKEELKKNKDDTKDKNEVDKYNEVNEYNENNEGNDYKDKKNKKKRHKKRKKDIIINTKDGINNEDAIKNEFIKQTDKFSRKYLNTVKTDLGLLLVEEQLKKNENLNNITEEILDLKGDLMNQLESIQMKQASEMKKIAYCLQNSGDEKVENLANRLFGEDILKPEDDELNFNSKKNSILYSMSGTKLGFSGTIFNNPNLLKTNNVQKKSSIDGVGRKSIGESRRKSIGESRRKSIDSNYKENKTSKIKFKDDDNYMKTKISTLLKNDTDTIIEENNDENYAD